MLVIKSLVLTSLWAQQWCEGPTCSVLEESVQEVGSFLLQQKHSKADPLVAIEEDEAGGNTDGETELGLALSRSQLDADEQAMSEVIDAPLNDEGLQEVLAQCCMLAADSYMRRVVISLNLEICDEGCYNGFITNFHCETGKSWDSLVGEILGNAAGDCWCFADAGKCGGEGAGPGPKPRSCPPSNVTGPVNPKLHRRRQCGKAVTTTTTTLAPGETTTLHSTTTPHETTVTTTEPATIETHLCELPAAVNDYSLITLGDAQVHAHEIYKGLAIGGTLTDGTPSDSTVVGGASFAKQKVGGTWDFKKGYTNGNLADVFDWSHFRWLARNIQSGWGENYNLRVFRHGGTFSSAGVDGWSNWNGQGEDNGVTLMVFKTNEDIRLVQTGNGRQFGPSVLAPFSTVTVDGNAGFVDGFIIAKAFGPSNSFGVGENAGSLQLHGDGYKGPIECKESDSLLAVQGNRSLVFMD
jgi:hypothetical protein